MTVGDVKKVLRLEGKQYISDRGKLDLPKWWCQLNVHSVALSAAGFWRRESTRDQKMSFITTHKPQTG